MSSALDAVLAKAEDAAANFNPSVPIAANDAQTGALALSKPTLDDFIDGGGMDVDEFIQVKAEGFRIGKDMQGLLEEVLVELNLSETTPVYSARFETGGNTTFIRSYDGVSTADGKNFQAEVSRLERTNQKSSGIYRSAEIPMTLVDDVADPKAKSTLVIEAGTTIGLTPSVTGFKPFQTFMKRLRNEDPSLLSRPIRVRLVHEKKTNSKNNEWGVINFERVAD